MQVVETKVIRKKRKSGKHVASSENRKLVEYNCTLTALLNHWLEDLITPALRQFGPKANSDRKSNSDQRQIWTNFELQNKFWSNKLRTAEVGPVRKSQNNQGGFFVLYKFFLKNFKTFFGSCKRV